MSMCEDFLFTFRGRHSGIVIDWMTSVYTSLMFVRLLMRYILSTTEIKEMRSSSEEI